MQAKHPEIDVALLEPVDTYEQSPLFALAAGAAARPPHEFQ
jgi:hypothetical protein